MYVPGLNLKMTAPYGLMILRVVLGIVFLVHGWSKLSGGVDNFAGFIGGTLGVPAPGFFAWVVTLVELVGGILLIVGFLTQYAGILLVIDMLGAILFAFLMRGSPFLNEGGSPAWGREAVYAAAALCIVLAGPGIWSVDDVVIDTRTRTSTA